MLLVFFLSVVYQMVRGHFGLAPVVAKIRDIVSDLIKETDDSQRGITNSEQKEEMWEFVLTEISVASLMEVCQWKEYSHIIYEKDKTVRKVFNTSSTAILIDGMQRTGLGYELDLQEAVVDLFLTIEGQAAQNACLTVVLAC